MFDFSINQYAMDRGECLSRDRSSACEGERVSVQKEYGVKEKVTTNDKLERECVFSFLSEHITHASPR